MGFWRIIYYIVQALLLLELFLHQPYILHFSDLNSHSDARQKLFIWQVARVEPSACMVPDVETEIVPLPASFS